MRERTEEERAVAGRPFTVPPEPGELMSVSREELMAMTEEELESFADKYLGIVLKPGWSRAKKLQNILSAAIEVEDI